MKSLVMRTKRMWTSVNIRQKLKKQLRVKKVVPVKDKGDRKEENSCMNSYNHISLSHYIFIDTNYCIIIYSFSYQITCKTLQLSHLTNHLTYTNVTNVCISNYIKINYKTNYTCTNHVTYTSHMTNHDLV